MSGFSEKLTGSSNTDPHWSKLSPSAIVVVLLRLYLRVVIKKPVQQQLAEMGKYVRETTLQTQRSVKEDGRWGSRCLSRCPSAFWRVPFQSRWMKLREAVTPWKACTGASLLAGPVRHPHWSRVRVEGVLVLRSKAKEAT